MMRVTVKTLDGVDHPFDIDGHITIAAFKERISQEINVPVECQRIIFQGRILQDSATIADSGIEDRVVHLVTRPPPGAGSSSSGTTSQQGTEANPNATSNQASGTAIPNHVVDIMNTMRTIFQSNLGQMIPSGQRANRSASQTRTGHSEDAAGNEGQEGSHQRISMARVRRRYIQRVLEDRLMPLIQRMDDMYPSERRDAGVKSEVVSGPPSEREHPPMETDAPSGSDGSRGEGGSSSGGGLDPELSNPLTIDALADITSEVETAWTRLALHLPRWRGVLREWATLTPSDTDRQQRQEQEFQFYDVMSSALHLYSHLLHNISDFMIDLSLPAPRHLMVLSGVAHQEIIEASIHLEASEIPHNVEGNTTTSQSNPATANNLTTQPNSTSDERNGDLGSRLRRMNVHSGNFGDLHLNNPMPSLISSTGGTFTVPIMVPGGFGMPLSTLMAENTGQPTVTGVHAHFPSHASSMHMQGGLSQDPSSQDDAHHQQNPLHGNMADPYLPCDSRHFLPADIVIRSRQLQTALSGQDSSAEGENGERRAQNNSAGSAVHINIPIVAAAITTSPGLFPDWDGITPPVNVMSGMNQPRATFRHTNRFPLVTATPGAPMYRPNLIVTRGSAFNLRGQGRGVDRNTRPSRANIINGTPAEDVRILLSIGRETLDRLIELLMPPSLSHTGTNPLDQLSVAQTFRQSPGWQEFFKRLLSTARPSMNIVQFSRLMESWIHRLSDRLQGQNNEQSYHGAVTLSSFLPTSALLRAFDDTRNPLFTWLEEQTRLTEDVSGIQLGDTVQNVRARDRLRSVALRLTFEWIHLVERDWLMTLPRGLSRQWIRPLVVLCLNHIQKTLQMFSAFRTNFGFGPLLCTYLLRWQMNLCNLIRTMIAQPGTEDILSQRFNAATQDGYQEWSTYLRNVRAHGPRSIFQRLTESQEQQFSILLHSRWSNAMCLNMTNSNSFTNILWRFTFFLYHCIEYGISATPSMASEAGLANLSEQANVNQLRTSLQSYFVTSTHIRHDQTRENLFLDMLMNLSERESSANGVNGSLFNHGFRGDVSVWNLSVAEENQIMTFYEQELLNVSERCQPTSSLTATTNTGSEPVGLSSDLSTNAMAGDSEDDNNSGFVTPPLDIPDRMIMEIEIPTNRRTVEELDRQLVVDLADIPINDPLASATISLTTRAFSQEQQQRFLESVGMETVTAEQARLSEMPPEWFPIIAADSAILSHRRTASQGTSTGSQTRFSDAYISGMPAKRRKLMQQRQDRISGQVCEDLLQDCIESAAKQAAKNECDASISTPTTQLVTTEEIGPVDGQLRDAFFDFVVEQLSERIRADADFSSERFPNAARLFRRNDSQN